MGFSFRFLVIFPFQNHFFNQKKIKPNISLKTKYIYQSNKMNRFRLHCHCTLPWFMIFLRGSSDIFILWPLTAAAFRESCWWQSVYWLPVNHWYFNIYLYREFFSFPRIIFFYLTSKTTFFEAKQLVEILESMLNIKLFII